MNTEGWEWGDGFPAEILCTYCSTTVDTDFWGWGYDDNGAFHLECLEVHEGIAIA